MKRWLLIIVAALPTPALAGWEFANWGMAPDQVVAASNGTAALVAEDKDKSIRDMARLASGSATVDGVNFTIDYFFDPKAKILSAINFVPADADCDAAIAGFKARLGRPKEKRKETVLDPRKPPLVTVEYEWRGGPLGKDKVSGVDVSVREMDIRYCQFLRSN